MKKVINYKLYDTDTAKEIGYWSNRCSTSDFRYCSETLYIKKTGEFFLYGDGGPMSKYSVSYGNSTSGGEVIIPFTEQEAKEWSMEHLTADKYIEFFGMYQSNKKIFENRQKIVILSLLR